jgi:hypothetical protein
VLKTLAWLEVVASIMLIALAVWPFSGYCSGTLMGLDCESRAIFGINLFGPLGILGLVIAVWSLKSKSVTPQYILLLGFMTIMIYWFAHAL